MTALSPLQIRGDTAANWTAANPVLRLRELACETDTRKFKVGDGATAWNSLAYTASGGGSGTVTSASVVSANGFAGTVATATTTPAITLTTSISGMLKGSSSALALATAGTDYVAPGAYTASGLTMATARLLGRTTASTGAAEEITVGSGLTLSAGTLTASGGSGTVTSVAALTLGTTGTDLSSSVANGTTTPVITLNVPTASASNRGALSSSDWSTFNGKQSAITFGTGVQTALGVNIGSAGAPVVLNGAGGTPSSMTGTNITGIPNAGLTNSSVTIGSTSVSLGATVATFAGVTLTSPTFTTPALGTPASGALTNCTSIPVANATGNLPVANLGSGTAASSTTFWRGDGTWATPAGGGSPGGSTTQVQYNNAGAFAGASGITTTGTELTIASGTKTTSTPLQTDTQTWNAGGVTFVGKDTNITSTASASGSLVEQWRVGGSVVTSIRKDGYVTLAGLNPGGAPIDLWAQKVYAQSTKMTFGNAYALNWASGSGGASGDDTSLTRQSPGVLKVSHTSGTTAGGVLFDPKTVANLPTKVNGLVCAVTDLTTTTPLIAAVGGGSNKGLVWTDGTTWYVIIAA